MRVLTCVGARPQFVKASVLSRELARRGVEEILVHTGQHYDREMSDVFFDQLALPTPRYRLGVGSAGHGVQTGEMMRRLEPVVLAEAPDWVVVFGDTNSTLAGALVASKLRVRLAHVEAGLRSFDRGMPEEINRVVADHVADLLFAPNERAAAQLRLEGIARGVRVAGDLMVDLVTALAREIPERPAVLERFGLTAGTYAVATVHRAANTDDPAAFARIVDGLHRVGMPVVFPIHPRTRAVARAAGVGRDDNVVPCEPLPYRETIELLGRAALLLTDSGGMQKEAYALRIPCVTLREETEWLETLEDGWNVLAGTDPEKVERASRRFKPARQQPHFGDGRAAERIVNGLYDGVEAARKSAGEVARLENGAELDRHFPFARYETPVRVT